MRKVNSKGFSLIEILIGLGIMAILFSMSFYLIYSVLQKAKITTAKVQIAQIAHLLEMVKEDTGYYPVFLSDLTVTPPPSGQEKGWDGPYSNLPIPLDPWGNPYFYSIPPTTLCNTGPLGHDYGKPPNYDFVFTGNAGYPAVLEIDNYGVTAATVSLNGTQIAPQQDFKKHPQPQILTYSVNLLDGSNTLSVWVASDPHDYFIAIVSGTEPSGAYFILGSYGNDGEPGGTGWNADITWISNQYPNFQ
jgi:general secretion pathway protein G